MNSLENSPDAKYGNDTWQTCRFVWNSGTTHTHMDFANTNTKINKIKDNYLW
jgi:hypothetical protein